MDALELQKELNMTYQELLQYLKNKYGKVPENYYLDVNCTRKSTKNGRGLEGLFCHHDFEYDEKNPLVNNLSQPDIAKQFDYMYQHAENLTYCNYLEHLILHCKINVLRYKQLNRFISDGVINFFIPDLNDLYRYKIKNLPTWKEIAFSLIEDNYNEYCIIIKRWFEELEMNYTDSWKNLTGVTKNDFNRRN